MNMRNVFPIAAVMACPMFLAGQTAAELVAKNLEARGGVEKIKAIKTLKITGKLQQGAFFCPDHTHIVNAQSSARHLHHTRHVRDRVL